MDRQESCFQLLQDAEGGPPPARPSCTVVTRGGLQALRGLRCVLPASLPVLGSLSHNIDSEFLKEIIFASAKDNLAAVFAD